MQQSFLFPDWSVGELFRVFAMWIQKFVEFR